MKTQQNLFKSFTDFFFGRDTSITVWFHSIGTIDTRGSSVGENMIREGPAEVTESRLAQSIPGGDCSGFVLDTSLPIRDMVVGQQPASAYQSHIARHEPGQNPLVLDFGAVFIRYPRMEISWGKNKTESYVI